MPFEKLCEVVGDRLGRDSRCWLDSTSIKKDVGWDPEISWEEGLSEMVDWGKKYIDVLKTLPNDFIHKS
jgi:dTDP-glucose 4,6-dehydratase